MEQTRSELSGVNKIRVVWRKQERSCQEKTRTGLSGVNKNRVVYSNQYQDCLNYEKAGYAPGVRKNRVPTSGCVDEN